MNKQAFFNICEKKIFTLMLFLCFILRAQADDNVLKIEGNFSDRPDVREFIKLMQKKYRFDERELIQLFSQVQIRPKIIRKIKSPLEQNPWRLYKRLYVTEQRIKNGLLFWNKYQETLKKAEQIYGVPASLIVATIGIESKYGKVTGEFRVIDALANLAFGNTSRTLFFRKELEQFLLLSREQHLNPLTILGSYAGAIGQPQFMPSSYRYYAVNFSGNPIIDLSNNQIDVIGSIANYYKKNGWRKDQPIAIPLSMLGGKYQLSFNQPRNISLLELIEKGDVPDTEWMKENKFQVIELENLWLKEYWLVFHNFNVIKRYNHNNLYAMAVFQLSYHIAESRGDR